MPIIFPQDRDYISLSADIRALCGRYKFLQRSSLGKSVLGKDLHILLLGQEPEYVLFAAAFHGTERITAAVVLRFVERLCDALETDGNIAGIAARKAFYGRSLAVVPMINPDGCDIALKGLAGAGPAAASCFQLSGGSLHKWNANARGIDLNHNFDAGFNLQPKLEHAAGITGPGPTRYGGTRPESEPETAALCGFCRRERVERALAFHSQGEEIYWKYGDYMPARSRELGNLFAASSGYTLSQPDAIASHGGFKDWFITEMKRPAYTIEMGMGQNPLPSGDMTGIYDRLEEMMMLALLL